MKSIVIKRSDNENHALMINSVASGTEVEHILAAQKFVLDWNSWNTLQHHVLHNVTFEEVEFGEGFQRHLIACDIIHCEFVSCAFINHMRRCTFYEVEFRNCDFQGESAFHNCTFWTVGWPGSEVRSCVMDNVDLTYEANFWDQVKSYPYGNRQVMGSLLMQKAVENQHEIFAAVVAGMRNWCYPDFVRLLTKSEMFSRSTGKWAIKVIFDAAIATKDVEWLQMLMELVPEVSHLVSKRTLTAANKVIAQNERKLT